MSKAGVSSRIKLVVLIDTVLLCRPFRLPAANAETAAETSPLKRADDTDADDSAARQAALFTLQTLMRLEGVSPPRTVSDALTQAREWVAAMAQLGG